MQLLCLTYASTVLYEWCGNKSCKHCPIIIMTVRSGSDKTDKNTLCEEVCSAFIPRILINYVASRISEGKETLKAESLFIHGVCLIVDISGFTALSSAFCKNGKNGIDGLQVCTNGFMHELVSVVHDHGGDIIKFAGDALVCIFSEPVSSQTPQTSSKVPIEIMFRAVHCAQKIRGVRTDRLTVHVGMSCGEICFGILGGVENRWDCLISGACIHQLSDCLDDAPSMQAVMTAGCYEILKHHITGAVSDQDLPPSELKSTEIQCFLDAALLPSGNRQILDFSCDDNLINSCRTTFSHLSSTLNPTQKSSLCSAMNAFVPIPVLEELDTSIKLTYFAEIREVTTMFMKWDSYDANGKHRDLMSLQACFYQAQCILHSTGAYLRQFLVDDKGCVLIACWGMPHMSYLDNAHRALSAAAQIRHEFERLEMETSVGITCADVYCGTVGSSERMEYAAIGSAVNMAARIMGKAKGRLLVDDSVYRLLRTKDQKFLSAVDPMIVKGRAEPLQVYDCSVELYAAYMKEKKKPTLATCTVEPSPACKATLTALIESLVCPSLRSSVGSISTSYNFAVNHVMKMSGKISSDKKEPSRVIVLQGMHGTGKSGAVEWLRTRATNRSIPWVSIHLEKQIVGARKMYTLWKRVFFQLSVKYGYHSSDGQWDKIDELFYEVFPDLEELAERVDLKLLCDSLGIGLTIPTVTQENKKSCSPMEKMVALRDAMGAVFAHILNKHPTLIIIENIHLAGERCTALLAHLVPKLSFPNAVVVTALSVPRSLQTSQKSDSDCDNSERTVTIRTAVQAAAVTVSPWYRTYQGMLMNGRNVTLVKLENYSREDIRTMLHNVLGTDVEIPEHILQLVLDYSAGSNFWVQEIIHFLQQFGLELFSAAVTDRSMTEVRCGIDKVKNHNPSDIMLWKPSNPTVLKASPTVNKNRKSYNPQYQLYIDKLVLGRFGCLTAEAQRVLRTASVIGSKFTVDVLEEVLPSHLRPVIEASLQTLVNQHWLHQSTDDEAVFMFAHPHVQLIILELTPASERDKLYAKIANYVDKVHSNDGAYFGALCGYFSHCDQAKALQYLVKGVNLGLGVMNFYEFDQAVTLLCAFPTLSVSEESAEMLLQLATNCIDAISQYILKHSTSSEDRLDTSVNSLTQIMMLPFRSFYRRILGSSNKSKVAVTTRYESIKLTNEDGLSRLNNGLKYTRSCDNLDEIDISCLSRSEQNTLVLYRKNLDNFALDVVAKQNVK